MRVSLLSIKQRKLDVTFELGALGYLEHLQQRLLLDLQPLKRLLLLHDFLAQGLQTGEVVAGHAPARKHRQVRPTARAAS